MREKIKQIQKKVGATPDGVVGPETVAAIMAALGIKEEKPLVWPTQKEVRSGKSIFGAPGSNNLVRITPPYQLWYDGARVSTIAVHKAVAEHVQAALREVLEYYGLDRIRALGLDQYGGCYNYRKTTAGSSLSMHAWGIALDFCPEKNAYSTKAPEASLSAPECAAWWDIWERHGAISLGRACDKDWMHVQFARLK